MSPPQARLKCLTAAPVTYKRTDFQQALHCVLQECGLKTYLFSYGSYYSSLSLKQLSEMFELPEMQVMHPLVAPLVQSGLFPAAT